MTNRILGTQTKINNPYNQYEIKAMDGIYSAIDEFEALGLNTDSLYQSLAQITTK
tara:strand:- start:70 stop:234 length:165 start_codon:yes stop_codon:yes gene_type:complete